MSHSQPYVILATDMLRAFFGLGLGQIEGSLLMYMIENSWGKSVVRGRKGKSWPDPIPCEIDAGLIASSLSVPVPRIYEAKGRLIKTGIIFKVEGGFLINKDADSWVKPGSDESRLSPDYLDYAASAQVHPKAIPSEPTYTVDRIKELQPSESAYTPDRIESEFPYTVDRIKSEVPYTLDRIKSTTSYTVDRSAALEERTRGNPTGSNTNSPRGGGNPRTLKKGVGQHLFPTSDDEPFISPDDSPIPPSPSMVLLDETTRPIHEYILAQTKSADLPGGNPDMADHVVQEFRSWVSQGYSVEVAKKAINKAIKKGLLRDAFRFSSYAQGALNGFADDRAALAPAPAHVPPSQTRPMTYFTGYKRPEPTGGNA